MDKSLQARASDVYGVGACRLKVVRPSRWPPRRPRSGSDDVNNDDTGIHRYVDSLWSTKKIVRGEKTMIVEHCIVGVVIVKEC